MTTPSATDAPAGIEERLVTALAPALPIAEAVVAEPLGHTPDVPAEAVAVAATFVGSRSADLVLVIADGSLLTDAAGTDGGRVTAADVLRPALEAAAAPLGVGVVAEPREVPAAAAIGEPGRTRYELRAGGRVVGWFGVTVRSAAEPTAAAAGVVDSRLGRISNVAMDLTVELGRVRMSVREVLSLEPGAVIELDRSVGAPADVLLNGRLIARGEVVVVDQDYAVRITRILDPEENA
jgi:flagellar motor switch protein FliN/FliY